MDKKAKKRTDVLRQKLLKLQQQLVGAKKQPDEPDDIVRLEKEIARSAKDLEKFDAKLSNQAFIANASPEVVDEVREKADAARELMNRMNEARKALRD